MITRYVTGIYRTYLSTLSHKKLSKKKKITMVKPFAGSSGMDILDIAAHPRQPLYNGLIEGAYEGFHLIM
jgi:hypothetical protein